MSRYENAKLLAGGQSLVPMLNFRILSPEHIIDLNKVSDLFGIKENENHLSIGSMTRQSELLNSPIIIQSSPLISRALGYVGHDQTRNRGTIGGSLCHLDPAAELCIVASAFNAELTVTGKKGDRVIAMSDWPVDFLTPALNDDEILTNIRITPWQSSHGFCFIEFARREGDFAIVAVAVLIEITDHVISKASIALGGVAAGPVRLHEVETLLTGQSPGQELFKEAGLLAKKVDAMSDINFSTDYRKRLSGAFTERALHGAMAQFKGEGQGHD
jgi:carbon-monoxide dehydrogenase medium subunit